MNAYLYCIKGLWTTIIIALLWREVRRANKKAAVPRDILEYLPTQILIFFFFLLLPVVEIVAGTLQAMYKNVPNSAVIGSIGMANLLISIYFWVQGKPTK